ncbi:MAG: peptide/nickel transport system substrate-binding protein, partial [Acetobacteraceae bacterium]|nr:peptide/nickel transport system substrate-binding protein [Acetobacteraceae bacterium]
MNVELVATDLGSVVQRRVSREPVERVAGRYPHLGGLDNSFTPVEYSQMRGLGGTARFDRYKGDTIEKLTRRFVEAATATERDATVLEIHKRAFEMVP